MADVRAPQSNTDLTSIAEARDLAKRAKQAWLELAEFSQERIDGIVDAMAAAVTPQAEALARLAVEVGLVVGTIAATTPNGSAISMIRRSSCRAMTPTVFIGRMKL